MNLKRFTSFALAFILCFALAPVNADALASENDAVKMVIMTVPVNGLKVNYSRRYQKEFILLIKLPRLLLTTLMRLPWKLLLNKRLNHSPKSLQLFLCLIHQRV